jgi:lipopolysaccharide export LptBFGC system permease protein LptF
MAPHFRSCYVDNYLWWLGCIVLFSGISHQQMPMMASSASCPVHLLSLLLQDLVQVYYNDKILSVLIHHHETNIRVQKKEHGFIHSGGSD